MIRYTDMSLNKDRLVNSLGGFWDEGVDRVCDVADNLEKSWHKKRKQARRQAKRTFRDGRDRALSLEESIADSVRNNSSIYLAIGVLLVALIVGKLIMGSSCCSSSKASSEDDW
jgi:hypothetical protein